jgi:hypothetical protein
MIRRPFASIGSIGLALTLSGSAAAHLSLKSINGQMPVARAEAPAEDLKASPCGQTTNGRTATVTALTAGAEITITWEEYIDHPGFYRIAFAQDGDTFPEIANMDDVTPPQCTLTTCMSGDMSIDEITPVGDEVLAYVADGEASASVVVPNVNCDNCTLQVIQFMTDKLGNGNDDEIYYQCADITITGAAAGGAGGAAGGGAGGGGAGGAAGGGAGGAASGAGGAASGAGGASGGAGGTAGGAGGSATAAGGSAGAAGGIAAAGAPQGMGGTVATPPAAAPAEEEGGCAMAPSQSPSPWSILVLGAAAMLFGLRRKSH